MLNINAVFRGALGATGATGTCFIAGTEIETVSGIKKIEDIVDGDKVVCAQWDDTTKEISYTEEEVYSKISHSERYHLLKTTLEDNTSFVSTFDHFIFSPDGSYKQACEFRVGDDLISYKDKKLVKIIGQDVINPLPTYNFEVKTHHNYIANGIVVHNGGLTKLQWNNKGTANNYRDNIVIYDSTAGEFENVTFKAPFFMQCVSTSSGMGAGNKYAYKLGYGYGTFTWDSSPDSQSEWSCVVTMPFNVTLMGYYITYMDQTNGNDASWTVKPYFLRGADQTYNFSVNQALANSSLIQFDATNNSDGNYGTPGNYKWNPTTDATGGWTSRPFATTNGWHFEAGDRVMFQVDVASGTVPEHTIQLVGVCDMFGGPSANGYGVQVGWDGNENEAT